MLSGAHLGIKVTSLLVGFNAEPVLGPLLQLDVEALGVETTSSPPVALCVGFVLATALQMLFGELMPKNLALASLEPLATGLASSTTLYLFLARPFILFFDKSANQLLRLLGIEPVEELRETASLKDLNQLVSNSAQHGSLTPAQASLLSRGLSFNSLRAADVMVPRPKVQILAGGDRGSDLPI